MQKNITSFEYITSSLSVDIETKSHFLRFDRSYKIRHCGLQLLASNFKRLVSSATSSIEFQASRFDFKGWLDLPITNIPNPLSLLIKCKTWYSEVIQ